jgi:hypothetical protein
MPTWARPSPVLPAVASMMTPRGFSRPSASARLDHGSRDAVLDRPARVGAFELCEKTAGAGVEVVRQLEHGRAADQIQG